MKESLMEKALSQGYQVTANRKNLEIRSRNTASLLLTFLSVAAGFAFYPFIDGNPLGFRYL